MSEGEDEITGSGKKGEGEEGGKEGVGGREIVD